MADLIDRQAAHDMVRMLTQYAWRSPDWRVCRTTLDYDDVQFGLDKLPAVEVARCGECIHRGKDSWCAYVDDDPNFYCKMGKRREENEIDRC